MNRVLKKAVTVVFSCVLGAIVLYGISGIVYFTNQIIQAEHPILRQFNQYIIFNNLVIGVLIVLTMMSVSSWLDRRRMSIVRKHLLISVISIGLHLSIATCSFFIYGHQIFDELLKQYPLYSTQDAPWYVYILASLTLGNLYYIVHRRNQQLTRKISEQEYQLLKMGELKTQAELDALQAKINPHFLYNSLNSIASLVHADPDKAEEMTLLLSKLFRYVTNHHSDHFDTLETELEVVRTYLDIEQVRFGDRLEYAIALKEDRLKDAQIPRFLLQPIVENSIKHGISKIAERGVIKIEISAEDGQLSIHVHDNGPLFPEPLHSGYGLRSIQEKLKILYGGQAAISLQNTPEKQVTIRMPFRQTTPTSHQPLAAATA